MRASQALPSLLALILAQAPAALAFTLIQGIRPTAASTGGVGRGWAGAGGLRMVTGAEHELVSSLAAGHHHLLADAALAVPSSVQETLGELGDALQGALQQNPLGELQGKLGDLAGTVQGSVGEVTSGVKGGLEGATSTVRGGLGGFAAAIRGSVDGVVGTAQGALRGAADAVGEGLSEKLAPVAGKADEARKALTGSAKQLKGPLEGIIDKVASFTSEAETVAAPARTALQTAVAVLEQVATPKRTFLAENVLVLPLWLGMIFVPDNAVVKRTMEGYSVIVLAALVYAWLTYEALQNPVSLAGFSGGAFDLDTLTKGYTQQVSVADGWAHFIAQDLFVGRWVYLDSRRNSVWAGHSLALCYLFGPIGVLSHLLTRGLSGIFRGDVKDILAIGVDTPRKGASTATKPPPSPPKSAPAATIGAKLSPTPLLRSVVPKPAAAKADTPPPPPPAAPVAVAAKPEASKAVEAAAKSVGAVAEAPKAAAAVAADAPAAGAAKVDAEGGKDGGAASASAEGKEQAV